MLESLINRITRASLHYKWLTIGISVFAMVAGIIALTQLNQELIPGIEFPQTVILAMNSGMEPEDMRDEVTIPIEDAVKDIDGVVNIESTTSGGFAVIVVLNEFGADLERIRVDIQTGLDGISYPNGMEIPEMLTFSFSDLPVASVSVAFEGSTLIELKELVELEIIPVLEAVPQVGNVSVSGGQELPTLPPPVTEPEPTQEPTTEATEEPSTEATEVPGGAADSDAIALPALWVAGASSFGMTLETTDDLTPDIIGIIAGALPQMLEELTPEMLLVMPVNALAVLPEEFLANLDADLQAQLLERIASAPPPEEIDPGALPVEWRAASAAFGSPAEIPEDVTPGLITALSSISMGLFDLLTPEQLQRFTAEALAWLPSEYIDSLDQNLRTQLDDLAQDAGGLGAQALAAEAAAAELAADAPALSGAWVLEPADGVTQGPTFETAADLVNSGFMDTAAGFLNVFVGSGQPNSAQMMHDLTPDVFTWLIENEEGFLENLDGSVLRFFSSEVLSALPDEFYASLDASLRAELEAIASGEIEAFIPTDTINRTDGNPSLVLTIFKDGDANTVAISHAIFEKLDELEAENSGLKFEIAFEQASFIEESINGVTREGGLGAFFAVVVILFFLSGRVKNRYRLSWRSTIVTGVSIPLSVFMAFALLKWLPLLTDVIFNPLDDLLGGVAVIGPLVRALHRLFPVGLTLNIMTLSGMTVAIGRVVDDSIVVLENIYRHIQRGRDLKESVLVGTRDVAIAIFASTVTTIIVFLPIGLLGGLIGEFFLPFGVAVSYALASSFLVAVTIVPLLAFMFIRKEHLPEEKETGLQKFYTPILKWSLNHRGLTLLFSTLLFLGSMYLLALRPKSFIPELGEVKVTTSIGLPSGTSMQQTLDMVIELEDKLIEIDGLGVIQAEIGSSGGLEAVFFGEGVNQGTASLQIAIENSAESDALTAEIREAAEDIFGEDYVKVSSGTLSSGAFGGFSIILSGDSEDLAEVNDEVIAALNKVDGVANASSNLADTSTILRVDGLPAVAFTAELETIDTLGVTTAAIADVKQIVPASVSVSEGFQTRQQTEGFTQATRAILISIIAVYFVMVITFKSFIHPFTILFSLPMAVIGAAVALTITDRVLGMSVLVGLMMLVGIVVTNAIVLIDRVQANRKKRGMNTYDALVEGGRTRLRPILMTAIAAMLALVPLALGLTEGAIIASELATVVIGGLFSSTFLTLMVVPVMYSVLTQLSERNQKEDA